MTEDTNQIAEKKGFYPLWMGENEIIFQILHQIMKQGGRVPYSLVIRADQPAVNQERLKNILEIMVRYKILLPRNNETDDLELGVGATLAEQIGFTKFKRIQKRKNFFSKYSLVIRILTIILIFAFIAFIIYFVVRIL